MASSMSSRQSKEVKVTLAVTVGNTGISRGNKANSGHHLVENHIKYSSTWNSILTNIVEKYFIHLIQHNYLLNNSNLQNIWYNTLELMIFFSLQHTSTDKAKRTPRNVMQVYR